MKIFKNTKTWALLSVLIMTVTGCEKQDTAASGDGTPLSITAIVKQKTKASFDKTAFAQNDEMYLWITHNLSDVAEPLKPETNYIDKAKFKMGASNELVRVAYNGKQVTFPKTNSRLDIYAVYPTSAVTVLEQTSLYADVTMPFSVQTDQTAEANYKTSDLLTASTTNITLKKPNADLVFDHRMAKILVKVNITPNGKYDGNVFASHDQFIVNASTTADVALNNMKATNPTSTTAISAHKVEVDATDKFAVYEMLVVPQTVNANEILFNIDATFGSVKTTFNYKNNKERVFESGKQYNYVVAMSDLPIMTLENPTIVEWGAGITASGNLDQINVLNNFTLTPSSANASTVSKVTVIVSETINGVLTDKSYEVAATYKNSKYNFTFDGYSDQPVKYPFTVIDIIAYNAAGVELDNILCTPIALTTSDRNTTIELVERPPLDQRNNPANCYIVNVGQTLIFNAQRIGKMTGTDFNAYDPGSYTTKDNSFAKLNSIPTSVSLKWQTIHGRFDLGKEKTASDAQLLIPSNGITYNTSTGDCTVRTTPGTSSPKKGGSAYLCAYNSANVILWSWHIWVTNEDITTITANGTQMQDRALGAIEKSPGVNSFGMMYQWGRKDPFTPVTTTDGKDTQLYSALGKPINSDSDNGINGVWSYTTSAALSISDLTQNPTKLYGNSVPIVSSGEYDWWNPTTKTLYDPCPAGYRIPPNNTYNEFAGSWTGSELTAGRTWNANSSFFPANGYRHYSSGQFYHVGSHGYGWMSTPNGATSGYVLEFFLKSNGTNHSTYRSFGFPVRCISE